MVAVGKVGDAGKTQTAINAHSLDTTTGHSQLQYDRLCDAIHSLQLDVFQARVVPDDSGEKVFRNVNTLAQLQVCQELAPEESLCGRAVSQRLASAQCQVGQLRTYGREGYEGRLCQARAVPEVQRGDLCTALQ